MGQGKGNARDTASDFCFQGFLLDHFDLRPNRGVRLGLLKYGDSVEVPITLGDYDSEAELLIRLGETRSSYNYIQSIPKMSMLSTHFRAKRRTKFGIGFAGGCRRVPAFG